MKTTVTANDIEVLSQAYAFLGNSLLKPMSQTSEIGLDPTFWRAFPTFDDAAMQDACEACACYAEGVAENDDAVLRVDVEYAHLFVGPPHPAAAPWEIAYRTEGGIGFGQATVEVRRTLADLGLAVHNENNQYTDHMGLELLCLSEICKRTAAGDEQAAEMLEPFVRERPASWAGEFAQRVRDERPNGYYAGVTAVVEALLDWLRRAAA